jgi:Tol biopolymer transport system component
VAVTRRNAGAVAGVAVVVLTAAGLVGAAPASAAYRGANGVIAFTSTRTGASQVYVRATDGTEEQLTNGTPGGASAPTFSPDGSRIAYSAGNDIWLMHADGTHKVNLTHDAKNNTDPIWAPDGTKIAFLSTRDVVSAEIYSMPAGGGAPHRITHNAMTERNLSWAPTGTRIAFDASGNGATPNVQIYAAAVATGAITNLSNNPYNDRSPDFSPSGALIVFISDRSAGGNLWLMSADGSAPTPAGTPNVYVGPVGPTWSADGSQIVTGANEGLGSLQLWSIDPGTGQGTQLTSDSGQPANANPSVQPLHQPALLLGAPSGASGSTLSSSGSDFLSLQTVKLTFRDAKKHTFALGTVKTDINGAFMKAVKVPAAAAKGAGAITATGIGGLTISVNFRKS